MSVQSLKNAVVPAPKRQGGVTALLETYKGEIARALPRHMTPDRLARIALTECRKNPQLLSCDPASFLGAVIQCAQLGLEPGGALGHAYLIPFDNRKRGVMEVQFMVGYRGMIDLARRSGQIVSLSARAVHRGDVFEYHYGLEESLTHHPADADGPEELTHVYAVARLKDGGVQFEVMSRRAVERVRAGSKAGNSGPWVTHFTEMAKKTVIRRLFKYLPVSIELQQAVGLDEQAEAGVSQHNDHLVLAPDPDTPDPAPDDGEDDLPEETPPPHVPPNTRRAAPAIEPAARRTPADAVGAGPAREPGADDE